MICTLEQEATAVSYTHLDVYKRQHHLLEAGMDNVLKMGVIGCGFFGRKHADVIDQIPNARLVAVCDIQEKAARDTAEIYSINFYTSCREMLEKEKIDAVSICVSEDRCV